MGRLQHSCLFCNAKTFTTFIAWSEGTGCEVQLRRSSNRLFGLADRIALSRAKHPRMLNCDGGRGLFSLGMHCNTVKCINTLDK